MRCNFFPPNFWECKSFTLDEKPQTYKRLQKLGSDIFQSLRKGNTYSKVDESVSLPKVNEYEHIIEKALIHTHMNMDPLYGKSSNIIGHPCLKECFFRNVDEKKKLAAFLVYLPFLIPFENRWTIFSRCMIVRYNSKYVIDIFSCLIFAYSCASFC